MTDRKLTLAEYHAPTIAWLKDVAAQMDYPLCCKGIYAAMERGEWNRVQREIAYRAHLLVCALMHPEPEYREARLWDALVQRVIRGEVDIDFVNNPIKLEDL